MHDYTPSMFAYWLKDITDACHIGEVVPHCTNGIRFIESQDRFLSSSYLYIAEASTMLSVLEEAVIPDSGLFFIVSGHLHPQTREDLPKTVSLLETNTSLLNLYNRVQQHAHAFRSWTMDLQKILYTNGGLQEMLQCASTLLDTTILLVNAGYKHIAAVYNPEVHDTTADELQQNGYQSFNTIQTILNETALNSELNPNHIEYISSADQNYTDVHLIRYQNDLVARLCIITNEAEPNGCFRDLNSILATYVKQYLFSHQGIDYSQNAAFGSLAADLIEGRLTDPLELKQRLKQFQICVKKYYHTIILHFDNTANHHMIPWNYVISQLEYIFPFSNITTYNGDILMIIRKVCHQNRPDFDTDKLLSLLEHYSAYACISNPSEFLTSLPTVYAQAKEALRLGSTMHPEQRLYYYEDYSMYQIIELASESSCQKLGIRDMIHLCNTEMTALLLYDKKYNTDLVSILHTYLQCERNTTETAKKLYMHRNTVLNKINKIEEIIGDSLDNSALRDRLTFSHYVLDYMQLYQKEDILILKRKNA